MADLPDVAAVRDWIRVPAGTLSDEQLGDIIAAEAADQAALCADDPYPDALRAALLRRCARHVAARGVPLGLVDVGDTGQARLGRWDAEVDRLEAPHRRGVLG